MNYKRTLFFIAKSLTISYEKTNRDKIEIILKANNVDWEEVVKVSTSHYVLPALYCNFKRANFLKYLPADLVSFMNYITNLNRNRNKEIIQQAKELNNLLLNKGVRPIFLKGTGNILEGLYEDIAERMIGDIDFLFSEVNFIKAIDILKSNNYFKEDNQVDHFPGYRHYSRLVRKNNIAAVEIHKDVIIEKHRDEFNFKKISEDTQIINNFSVLSFENQLSLSIITAQINDYGFKLNNFSLRNAYDIFLLSKKVDTISVISNFSNLKKPLNCFLANCDIVFGGIDSLKYIVNKESKKYSEIFLKSLYKRRSKTNIKLIIINLRRRFSIFCRSIFNKKNRKWLLNRIKSRFGD